MLDLGIAGPVLVVAAHPDDEVIGLGGHLDVLPQPVYVVHVTDGAPRSRPDWAEYAALRRNELRCAMDRCGIDEGRCFGLNAADQEAIFHVPALVSELVALLRAQRPSCVFTHPYEGGHPDHDAAALLVAEACRVSGSEAVRLEFTSYHAQQDHAHQDSQPSIRIESGCFLNEPGTRVRLTDTQRQKKAALFHCYSSQAEMLAHFRIDEERVRPAPRYDFSVPPHPGRLFYEDQPWGMSWKVWSAAAARALEELSQAGP